MYAAPSKATTTGVAVVASTCPGPDTDAQVAWSSCQVSSRTENGVSAQKDEIPTSTAGGLWEQWRWVRKDEIPTPTAGGLWEQHSSGVGYGRMRFKHPLLEGSGSSTVVELGMEG